MRTRIAVLLVALSASCTQTNTERRLAPRDLPTIGPDAAKTPRVTPKVAGGSQPAKPGVEVAEFLAVPPERVLEDQVFAFLQKLLEFRSRARLLAVVPGTTLMARLQYCLCRIQLRRAAQIIPELERLTRDHPTNATVWRILGIAYGEVKQLDQEIQAFQKCYEVDVPGQRTCQNVIPVLGERMLARPALRDAAIGFMREQLAKGPEFMWAAVRLVDVLSAGERHAEGLVCVDAALLRAPDSALLKYRKAVVLFDLHRLKEAVAILEPLVDHQEFGLYAKEHLVRSYLLEKRQVDAQKLVDQLLLVEGIDEKLKTLYRHLASQVSTGQLGLVDVYSILRGCDSLKVCLHCLEELIEKNRQRPQIMERALHIAFNSDHPLLRIEALGHLADLSSQPLVDLRAGFSDVEAKVRAMAAMVSPVVAQRNPAKRTVVVAMVFEAMEKELEKDAYAFRILHKAMGALTGVEMEFPFGTAKDLELRRDLVKAWKDRE